MGHVERETRKLVRTNSSDPAYGKALAWVWGGMLGLGVLIWIVTALSHVPAGTWLVLAVAAAALGLLITWVVVMNRRDRKH
jgi:Flp pilus assembly protein TadB